MKIATIALFLFASFAQAQIIQDFKLMNVTNGQEISLGNYSSSEGAVIIFTSNACAFDNYYVQRIKNLAADFSDKLPILLVNSSVEPTESISAMTSRSKQNGWNLPYLADKDQQLMNALGATKSPEVFLLKKNGNNYSVVYRGAFDDNPQVEADVDQHYLKTALENFLSRQAIEPTETRPVGCTIRKKN